MSANVIVLADYRRGPEQPPWYALSSPSAADARRALEDERSRVLAGAVGDHLPVELALRAAAIEKRLSEGV